MSYSFEDSTPGGDSDGGTVETSARVERGGVPRWLLAIIGVGAFVLFVTARSNLPSDDAPPPPTTAPSVGFPTTTAPVPTTAEAPDVLVTSPPGQLTHEDMGFPLRDGEGVGRAIAVRQGSRVLVMDPNSGTAHKIELPVTPAADALAQVGRDDRTMALVAGKVIIHEGRFLRSLSSTGGVDVLLSNSSFGFEVATPTAIVAAIEVVSSSEPEDEIRLVPQGVHFPSGRDQVVGVFGVPDLDLLPPGSELSIVDGKIFVRLNGEIHRKTPEGLVSLGSRRVYAASESAAIVERCVALFGNCSYSRVNLDDLGAAEVALDVPLSFSRSTIVMSADGMSLMVVDDGSTLQSLVDISSGEWNVVHEFAGERFTAAAFDPASETWVLGYSGFLNFWTPAGESIWGLPAIGRGPVDEIAIASETN